MSDNFSNYPGNDGAAVTMCKYSGVFILGMRALNYAAQQEQNAAILRQFSLVSLLVWGFCGVLTVMNWDTTKRPNGYINLGLQIFFTLGYAKQYMDQSKKESDN